MKPLKKAVEQVRPGVELNCSAFVLGGKVLNVGVFPDGFAWGVDNSVFPIEGADDVDGRRPIAGSLKDDYGEKQGRLAIDRNEPGVKLALGVSYSLLAQEQ